MVDYLEQGRTINGAYYAAELRRLCQDCKKEERKIDSKSHTSQVAMTAATECGFEVLPHAPYSPDMAPSDFSLFPKLKSNLRGTQFGSNEGVITAVNEYLEDQE